MLNSQETRILKRPMIGWEIREITFQQYRENLAKTRSFPMGYKYPRT